jgi:EAL domain-containing protein (putative c-di-GMP-specific phosphodiesterase class I)/GGDEF domain-containing protein
VDHAGSGTRGVRLRFCRVFPLSAVPESTGFADVRGLSHRELLTALTEALTRAKGSLALLLIDIADLPTMQARLGFEVSAALVQCLSERFRLALGERGSVLRFGDARFCVLVQGIRNRGHAILAAEKMGRAAEEAMSDAAVTIAPEINIGIALYPLQAADAEGLLRKAQLAAAAVHKRAARLQVFDESCTEQVLKPWELGAAFAEALRSGELQVHYQPKLRIADRRPVGVESLLRWLRGGEPVATPDVFIPLAEEAGLIQDLTWHVLSNSLQQAAASNGLRVAVNITPGMLHHRDFVEMIRSAVATWNVMSGGLTLEITEGALIVDFEEATARLARLRELGVRISIDDFGTGYSSLSYFKKIPADELKIDKSFVMRMLADEADQKLVETIITLARQFRLDVVAEGVENQATLDMLARMGCDYAQGFLFAPALHAEQLAVWLRANSH